MTQTNSVKQDFTFPGFRSPNYTQVPDELFDLLLPDLGGAELKVLLYIIRRTFGFKKGSDRISKAQLERGIQRSDGTVLDLGTGLSRRAIRLAVDSLVHRNVLIKHTYESAERGNEAAEYAVNVVTSNETPWVLSTPPLGKKVPKGLGTNYTPQETVLQETDKQQQYVVASKTSFSDTFTSGVGETNNEIAEALTTFGISKFTAQKLTRTYPEDYLLSKLELAQFLVDKRSPLVAKNPAGYLRKSIEEDYNPPKGYKTKAQREDEARERSSKERHEQKERHRLEEAARHERAALYTNLDKRYPPVAIPGTGFTTRTAWEAVKAYLRQSLPEFQCALLEDAMLVLVEGGTAIVGTTNRFLCRHLAHRLGPSLQGAFQTTLKQPLEIHFQVLPESS